MKINLLDGELLTGQQHINIFLTDEQINKKYVDGEIRIITEQGRYPLDAVAEMFSKKEKYKDNIDYQRNYVWSNEKRSLLIESFILNVPIPPIFLYEVDYSYYEILDGKQRVSTIVDFYKDKFSLVGLEIWSELNGKRYCQLPEKIKEGLNRRYLSSIIMLKESEKDSFEVNKLKKLVFERLNTGGLKLSPQESRNAIFSGPFNDACKELAENEYFKLSWGISKGLKQLSFSGEFESDISLIKKNKIELHMMDVELVLRFFACRQIQNYEKINLSSFLDIYLDNANKYSSVIINGLKEIFSKTIELAYKLFDKPFRLIKYNKYSNSAVRTVYDPLMQVISLYIDRTEEVLNHKNEIQAEYAKLIITNEERFSGKIQHKASIIERFNLLNDMFINILG